jgi:hypothetical protein
LIQVLHFSKRETIEGIEVRGTAEFRLRTREALEQLKPLPQFGLVHAGMAVIRQGRRSGMKASAARPTFVVGSATWRHSVRWYAGAIAHDAYHAKLYRQAKQSAGGEEPCADAWTGVEAEKLCLAFQHEVLAELGADEKMLAYIDRCARNPAYQGRSKGWKSWLDYLKRWW